MSRNAKIILGLVGGALVLCLCGGIAAWYSLQRIGRAVEENMVIDDPARAAESARSMIDFDLPPGYRAEGFMDMFVAKMAIIGGRQNQPVIMIMEWPAGMEIDDEEARLQAQQSIQQSYGQGGFSMRPVAEQTTPIRGVQATVWTFDGVDENGVEMRQMFTSLFPGKNGSVMVFIVGAKSNWDQAIANTFINSIR